MSDQKAIIRNSSDRDDFIVHLIGMNLERPIEVVWKNWTPKRSLPANALYWVWMGTLAKTFNEREFKQSGSKPGNQAQSYDKDDMHNICRHFCLGYETIQIRNTVIIGQLKSTAKLTRTEFCHYMEKVSAWSVDINIRLPYPVDSEYSRYLEQNT